MKKITALVLVGIMLLTGVSTALAAGESVPFHIVTENTENYQIGTSKQKKTQKYWHISIDESTSNVTPTHRAVTRVHKGYDAISSTWVYEGQEYDRCPYKTNYTGVVDGITFRGRLDNRDSGVLEFHGIIMKPVM